MDAGELAQSSFNNLSPNNFGVPNSFSSRGKGTHIKRLSVAPPNMNSINENEVDHTPAPRTSRAHMLSGLRTAPKVNTGTTSASAPYTQTHFGNEALHAQNVQPAYGTNFAGYGHNSYGGQMPQQVLSPDQVLAPSFHMGTRDLSHMDQQTYNQYILTNMYLAQRQQQLQQQLMNVQAAAQQFQTMNLNGQQSQYSGGPVSPTSSIYNQQLQNGMQPVVQAVPNQPGIYSVYNPMTGQQSFYPESALTQQDSPQSPEQQNFQPESTFALRSDKSLPPATNNGATPWARTATPPRQTPSPPQEVAPLPQPSANAYRPSHRRSISSLNKGGDVKPGPRSAGMPPTPVDGTFGLGLGRAGEHPVRQPRGPPAIEELKAAPTSKHEGSKNFATRQRRRALFNLVRAGNERRVARPGSAHDDLPTPGSDSATPFGNSSSDGESDGTQATASLSAHSSFGSLRAAAGGAIGSEVKKMKERSRERDTFARRLTGDSNSSNEDKTNAGSGTERRRTPMLVLTSAEKRKSSMSFGNAFN
ncbi:MAG: hypothetical protein Q9162_000578 [Coniocarpon cinnabarinum]